MNKEIARINEKELELGISGSWHDQYKDSAYVYVGNLPRDLTEGDVITVMSQYGEVMDIHMPRDKETGKIRGFGFLMYEDQRSTVLAVDNLNGAKLLERTIRVDHVSGYKQPKRRNDDGELVEPTEQSLNAQPELIMDGNDAASSSSDDEPAPQIDPDDPMRDYLLQKHREERERRKKKKKTSTKHANETPEERRERKLRRREKKERKAVEARKGAVEQDDRRRPRERDDGAHRGRSRSRTPPRREPEYREREYERDRQRPSPVRRRSRSRSPPPRRRDFRD